MVENNIKELRKDRKLTAAGLAELCNTTQAQISRLENSVRNLDFEWAERISKVLGVRPFELLKDENWNPYAVKPRNPTPGTAVYPVPVLEWSQAYTFVIDAASNPDYLTSLSKPKIVNTTKTLSHSAFALLVNDDSMLPRFMPGDIVVIDPEQSVHVGEYCLFTYMEDSCALRTLTQTDKYFIFEPINPIYPSLSYKTEIDVYDKILGKLIDLIPQLYKVFI